MQTATIVYFFSWWRDYKHDHECAYNISCHWKQTPHLIFRQLKVICSLPFPRERVDDFKLSGNQASRHPVQREHMIGKIFEQVEPEKQKQQQQQYGINYVWFTQVTKYTALKNVTLIMMKRT